MDHLRPALFAAAAAACIAWCGLPAASLRAQSSATGTLALVGGRVIDGTGRPPIENATLIVSNGRFQAVGREVAIPAGATRIDLAGKTVMPGLINAHGHLNADVSRKPVPEKLTEQLRVYADYGVTTNYVLGTGPEDLADAIALRDARASAPLDRARLFVAGPSIRGLENQDAARAAVNRYADARVDIVKIHITGGPDDMTPAVYGALIDQAHKRGLRVAAHLFYLKDAHGLVDAGVDVMAHSVRDLDVDAALVAAMKQRGIGYIPTFTRDLAQFVYESTPPFFNDPFFNRRIDAFAREAAIARDPVQQAKTRASQAAQGAKAALAQAMKNLKTLSDGGVPVALGTDSGTNLGQWQGYFEHVELEYMVKAGLTPMQAVVAATGGAARVMKLDDLGTIQPGKVADLLVLDADPLADIRNTRRIESVWLGGLRLDVPATN